MVASLAGLVVALVTVASASVAVAGDWRLGEALFEHNCRVCHAVLPEYHKEGPSLYGVFGRRAGTAPFFPRYVGLKGSTVTWDEQTLDRWLADPRAFLGGHNTTMTFELADAGERADIIAYLKTLK